MIILVLIDSQQITLQHLHEASILTLSSIPSFSNVPSPTSKFSPNDNSVYVIAGFYTFALAPSSYLSPLIEVVLLKVSRSNPDRLLVTSEEKHQIDINEALVNEFD
jgi:hypothetical protein